MGSTSRFLSLTALVLTVGASTAAAQTFFGQDNEWYSNNVSTNSDAAASSFLAGLTGVGTETFDGFGSGTGAPLALNFGAAGTATLQGTGVVDGSALPAIEARRGYSDPNFFEIFTTDDNGASFSIDFSQEIVAFGFYAIDVGDFGAQLNLEFFNGATSVGTWAPGHAVGGGNDGGNNGNLNYFGFIDTNNPFDEVRFTSTGGGEDAWGFDNMTIGTIEQISTVPEPATMTLLATGLAGMAASRRRRKKA